MPKTLVTSGRKKTTTDKSKQASNKLKDEPKDRAVSISEEIPKAQTLPAPSKEPIDLEGQGFRLTCTQDDLANNLALVAHAVPAKPTHPVLGNVLLVADKELQQVHLTVFDLNLGIETSLDAKIWQGGEITIPVELLSLVVAKFPSGDITLSHSSTPENKGDKEQEPEWITTLKTGETNYQMRGMASESFPKLPSLSGQVYKLPTESLKEGLRGTLFATVKDETKRILTGVHIKLDGTILEFAATDGHRLATVQTSIQGISTKPKESRTNSSLSFTIPAKVLIELDRILSSRTSTEPVELSYEESSSTVAISWGRVRLIGRCLEGQYPPYPALLNQQFAQTVTLEKAPLIKALERLSTLADKKEKTVSLYLNSFEEKLSLSITREFGKGQEEIAAAITEKDLQISFDIRYLLEGVKSVASNQIQICFTQHDGPAVIAPFGNRDKPNLLIDSKYLLMPIQIGVAE